MEDNNYNIKRTNQIKQFSRIKLGFQQFIHNKPFLNLLWLFVIFVTAIIIVVKNKFIEIINITQLIEPIFDIVMNVFAFLIPILMVFAILEKVGECTARRYEAEIRVAFSDNNLKNGFPILVSKKKIKGTDVTVCEFYSNIPYAVWVEKKEAIADAMNIHFVEEIAYGGKNNNNGKIIVVKIAKGRKAIDRGTLYDDEF